MKYLFILLFVITFSNSTTLFNGDCIESYFVDGNKIVYITSDSRTLQVNYSDSAISSLVQNTDKFYFDSISSTCNAYNKDSNNTLLMAFTGLICGTLLASTILHKVI